MLLYAPALIPGHTLSASDYLWSAAPWAAERPPDIRVLGSNYELVDAVTQFQPWLEHSRQRLPSPPLWNPHVAAGRPFLANAQSAVLSPFSVPGYVLPFWWSLGVIAVLKVFVAAFGTYLLARALGMRFGGALLAGIVYAFSLYFVVWIAWPQTNVWALLPWLFLLADRTLRAPTVLSGAGLAVVVALQFLGGHPESNLHLLVATVAFFAFRVVALRRRIALAELRRPLLALTAGLAGGAALAAVALVPFLELLFRSADIGVREGYWELALPERYLLGFLLPDYWGRAAHAAVGAFAQERALYVGALPLILAVGAVVARPTLQRVGLAAFGALLLAIAVGVPPLPQIASAIPIVKTGNHLRVVVILMLCLALLAGFGLDDLAGRRVQRHRAVLLVAAALFVLPVLVLAARGQLSAELIPRALEVAAGIDWPSPPPEGDDLTAIRMGSLVVWLVFAGLAVLLLAATLRGRLGGAALVVLVCGLTAGDLFKAGMGATPAIGADEATQPSTTGIEYLQGRRPNRFVGLDRRLGPSPLIPNLALRWSLYDARSYDLPVDERYDALWRRAVVDGGPADHPTSQARVAERALPAFRLLSVTDIVQDPQDPPVRDPALPVAYDRRDLRVYANPGALPRAGVVDVQRVVASEEAELDAVLDPGFDGRRTVVTSTRLPGLRVGPPGEAAGSARIVVYEPERVVVEAVARQPSELVLTDLHHPGWNVELDGENAALHRVNYLLRGTSLPAGRHRVEFRYEPRTWRLGWIVSLVALAALGGAVGVALRGRRGEG
jgi:hypothetical protein